MRQGKQLEFLTSKASKQVKPQKQGGAKTPPEKKGRTMKKAINYKLFNANGVLVNEITSRRIYTVRGAMEWLESNGFTPMDDVLQKQAKNKLKYVYEKWHISDSHTIAYII